MVVSLIPQLRMRVLSSSLILEKWLQRSIWQIRRNKDSSVLSQENPKLCGNRVIVQSKKRKTGHCKSPNLNSKSLLLTHKQLNLNPTRHLTGVSFLHKQTPSNKHFSLKGNKGLYLVKNYKRKDTSCLILRTLNPRNRYFKIIKKLALVIASCKP